MDEVFVTIRGERHYLWRAVDQDGDVLDIFVQPRRDRKAAKRFFRKLLKGQDRVLPKVVTNKLRSYPARHATGVTANRCVVRLPPVLGSFCRNT